MRMFKLLVLAITSLCALGSLHGQPHPYLPCQPDPLTGNTVALFDWRTAFYEFHIQGEPGPLLVPSPFYSIGASPEQINTLSLAIFPPDYEPEAGWEVLLVNFGTPSQKVSTPSLVLYNRLNGIMRILQYAKGDIATYDNAIVELKQILAQDVFDKNSAVFEHMNTPMNALDNFSKGIAVDFPNTYQNFPANTTDRNWLMGEVLTAYDPCTCSHPTRISIQPRFTDIVAISLDIEGQSTTVPVYEQQSGPSGGIKSAIAGGGSVVNALAKGGKTYKDLGGFESFLNDAYGLLPTDNVPAFVSDVFSSAFGAAPGIGTAISLLDLFVSSSKAPSVASYDADYTFEATGTLEKVDMQIVTAFRTPGATGILNVPPNMATVQTLYDNPLGIMNLLETPEVQAALKIDLQQDKRLLALKLADENDIKYVLNEAAGFHIEPQDIRFQLVLKDCFFSDPAFAASTGLKPTGNANEYATPLMPASCLEDYVLRLERKNSFPYNSLYNWCESWNDMKLKVVASLKNGASDALYSATYNLNVNEAPYPYESAPYNPYTTNHPGWPNPGIKEFEIINYEDFDPRKLDLEVWDQVIIQNVPITVIIDPQNPNIQTLIPDTYDPNDVPFVGVFPGDLNETYDVIFEGLPPCAYTQPASAEDIAEFCMNDYNPSAGLVDDEEPLTLQSAPAAPPQSAGQPRIKLYPQPAGDWAQLELPDGQDRGRLLVMDAYGQTVPAQDIRSPHIQLNIAALPAGLYILSIDLLDGQPPYTERLAKQ